MSERSAVQNPMLRYADQIGWTYIPKLIDFDNCDRNLFHVTDAFAIWGNTR